MAPVIPLSSREITRRLRPKNSQLGRLVERIASPRCQKRVIRFWNEHRALPRDIWAMPQKNTPRGNWLFETI